MMSLKKIFAILLFSISLGFSGGVNSNFDLIEYEELYQSGNMGYEIGSALAWTGLVVGLGGALFKNNTMLYGGFIVSDLAIASVVGSTIDMAGAITNINSEASEAADVNGWGVRLGSLIYPLGMISKYLGVFSLTFKGPNGGASPGKLPIYLVYGGAVLEYIGWAFSANRASRAETARDAKSPMKLSLSPLISSDNDGRLYGGLQTRFSF